MIAAKYKEFGVEAYKSGAAGRPEQAVCPDFRAKIRALRHKTAYGSRKLHVVTRREGFSVSQRQIQKILDQEQLTTPCAARRGQRRYVKYQWPISNWMWHADWTFFEDGWYCAYLDDRSRKIMNADVFSNATEKNALLTFYQAVSDCERCPVILLSDKGTQFYNSKKNSKGERPPSQFEKELKALGIEFWTCRRGHPQTNGKLEKWIDTMKQGLDRFANLSEFVLWYNEERIHESLNYRTPSEVYAEKL